MKKYNFVFLIIAVIFFGILFPGCCDTDVRFARPPAEPGDVANNFNPAEATGIVHLRVTVPGSEEITEVLPKNQRTLRLIIDGKNLESPIIKVIDVSVPGDFDVLAENIPPGLYNSYIQIFNPEGEITAETIRELHMNSGTKSRPAIVYLEAAISESINISESGEENPNEVYVPDNQIINFKEE